MCQVEKEKRRAAARAAADYEKAKKNQGWVSWMMGGPPKPSNLQDSSDDMRADLNDEEYQKLEEIVSEQEKAVNQGESFNKIAFTHILKNLVLLVKI